MRVKRIIIMTVLVMIVSVFCCGCGKSDPIVGTWKAFDFDYDGTLLSEIDPENDMLKNPKDTTIKDKMLYIEIGWDTMVFKK